MVMLVIHQRYRRTARPTDGRHAIARLCFAVCTIVHRAVKQRRNTGIADIIGIADIVLLSILPNDPALDGNAHTAWNDNAKNVFQNEHSVLGNANC